MFLTIEQLAQIERDADTIRAAREREALYFGRRVRFAIIVTVIVAAGVGVISALITGDPLALLHSALAS